MNYVIDILAAVAVGILLATARVPRVRWVPLLALAVLVVTAGTIIGLNTPLTLWDGLVFLIVAVLASGVYGAVLWLALGTVAGTFWELLTWELFRPQYVRALHRQTLEHVSPSQDHHEAVSRD